MGYSLLPPEDLLIPFSVTKSTFGLPAPPHQFRSQRLEERDQCLAVGFGEIEPEVVTFYGKCLDAIWLEASRHIIVADAGRVKPIFQSRAPAPCGQTCFGTKLP